MVIKINRSKNFVFAFLVLVILSSSCQNSNQVPLPNIPVIKPSPSNTPNLLTTQAQQQPTTYPIDNLGTEPISATLPYPSPVDLPIDRFSSSETSNQISAFIDHPELEAVTKAVESNDPDLINPFIQFIITPCTRAEGLGGPPKCAQGQSEGDLVEVFPISGSEGFFSNRELLTKGFGFKIEKLEAIYLVPDGTYQESYWPAGEYGLVFRIAAPFPITLRITEGKIVRLDMNMGSPLEMILESYADQIIYLSSLVQP